MSHKQCMQTWYEFYVLRSGGIKPKIGGGEGKAIKELVKHLTETYPDVSPEIALKSVFDNWDRLEPFYQKFIDIKQINSSWNNIINRIKNATGQEGYEAAIREIQRS